MIYELVYTSAPTGLFPGNTGFSVVGCTRNMDMALCKQLEKLSAYTPLYPHYDANAWNNPVNFAHRIINTNGQNYHILSRICFNGVDYTNRSNKLASHLAISENELNRLSSGPASIFLQPGLFKDENWRIQTGFFEVQPSLFESDNKLQPCSTWQQITGDAGWAGFIAENVMTNPQRNVYIVFSPEQSKYNLQLLVELLSLLPPPVRWQLTFSTYFTELVPGTSCNLRFCLPNNPLLQNARQNVNANLVIDISRPLPAPSGGNLLDIARTGKLPEAHASLRPTTNVSPSRPQMTFAPKPVLQPTFVAPKDNGIFKVVIAIMAVALLILGVMFIVSKRNSSVKIAELQEKLKQNEELISEELIEVVYKQLCTDLEAKRLPEKPKYKEDELKKESKEIEGQNGAGKKGKELLDFIAKVEGFIAEWETVSARTKEIETLLKAIMQIEAKIGKKNKQRKFNLGDLEKQAKEASKEKTTLKDMVDSLKLSIDKAWSKRDELVSTLEAGKKYELYFKELEGYELRKGQDGKEWIYDGEKSLTDLPAKIELKNGKLTIIPQKKDAKSNFEWKTLKLSIGIIRKEEKKGLYFYLNNDKYTKDFKILEKGELYYQYFEKGKKLNLILDDCLATKDIIISLSFGDKNLKMVKKGNMWIASNVSLPALKEGQEKDIKQRIEDHFKGARLTLENNDGWKQEVNIDSFMEKK